MIAAKEGFFSDTLKGIGRAGFKATLCHYCVCWIASETIESRHDEKLADDAEERSRTRDTAIALMESCHRKGIGFAA